MALSIWPSSSGWIDDLRIYGYALTQEQIKKLCDEGESAPGQE